jgi:hypothetical protein
MNRIGISNQIDENNGKANDGAVKEVEIARALRDMSGY